jgi:hypothetical protein
MTPQGREVNKQMKLEDFSKSEPEGNSLRTAPDGDLCFKRRAPRTLSDVYPKRRNIMTNRIIRVVLLMATLLSIGSVSVQADTSPVPLCYPRPCQLK